MAHGAAGLEPSPPAKHNLGRLDAYERHRAGRSVKPACCLRLILLSAVAVSLPVVRQAVAATINVPGGTDLHTLPLSDLANGNILSLQGNATLSGSLALPSGSPGLTINGNGNSITLTNGDFALPGNTTPNFPLQNVTIAGGNNASAISGNNLDGVNIPITGSVTFSNINTTQNGSAIGVTSNGTVAIGATGSTVSFDNNTAHTGGAISITNAGFALLGNATFSGNAATAGNGGAIISSGNSAFTINGPMVEFTGNTATGGGGAIFAQNNSIIVNGNVDGNVTLSNNKAMGGNGGAIDEASNSVSIGSAGSTVIITGNTASANGGAIFSQNNSITVDGDVTLSNNHAMGGNGGAMDEASNSVSIGSAGSTVVITRNTATANGGAINSQNTGVTINGADITLQQNTAGGNGGAIDENNGPALIGDASGATVNIIGNVAGSVAGSNGGAIYDNDGSITVNGNVTLMNNMAPSGSGGAIYETNGSVLISNSGGNVSVTGNTAEINGGAIYEGGGGAVMIGSSAATVGITTNTADSSGGGIYSQSGPVTITGNGITIEGNGATTGNGGAIYEGGGGAVMIGSSAATVGITSNMAGSSGGGIYSQNGPVTITGDGIAIEGNGATTGNGGAVYAGNGFTLNANGTATISSNAAGRLGGAIYLNSGSLNLNATGGNIIFSGNTENGGAPNAIYFNAGSATFNATVGQRISFFDPIESNSASGIVSVTKTGPGTVSFDGSQNQNISNIFAQTTVQDGAFEVAHNAVYGVNAANTSFTVNPGATLRGGVAGTVAANQFTLQSGATLNIAGNASVGSPFSVFTIDAAQASFQSGSRILFNTQLNDGLVQNTDLLVLSHAVADAPGGVVVTNSGGQGAETVGNGIRLVEATNGATTTPNNFALVGEVRGGAFTYDLFRGGLNPSNFSNDWFLRSSFVTPPIPPEPPTPPITPPIQPPITPPIPPFPVDPPPNPLPPNVVFPIIGPELATYGVVQPLARQLGLSILGTLDDRVGDTYEPYGCGVQPAPETSSVDLPTGKNTLPTRKAAPAPCPLFWPSVWGRFFGQTIDNRYSAFADPRASGNMGGFQGGIDLLRGSLIAGHTERAGLYGAYGNVNSDVTGLVTNPAATAYILTHTGAMSLNAWSAGGYWTHVGPGGWYLDAVLQGTWYGGSASTQYAKLDTNGTGFIGSLEGGVPFSLPQLGPGFVLEPQGQILWQKVSFAHAYDGLGDVALGDTTGPSGRIGLKTKWTIVTAGGQVWQPYVSGNLWRDWGAEANTVFSGADSVPLVNQATMLEFGGGLTGRLNANVSVFANVDYEFAVGAADDKRNGVRGAFGARYTW
jgi:outer membrane autotransporter protein